MRVNKAVFVIGAHCVEMLTPHSSQNVVVSYLKANGMCLSCPQKPSPAEVKLYHITGFKSSFEVHYDGI